MLLGWEGDMQTVQGHTSETLSLIEAVREGFLWEVTFKPRLMGASRKGSEHSTL